MNKYIAALPSIRPPFLTLAPLCTLLGIAYASAQGIELNMLHAILAVIGAIFSAIAVNTINEYQDFHSGLDLVTKPTPFSGGSGLLKAHPELAPVVKSYAIFAVSIVILIGLYFLSQYQISILPIGILGLFIVISYTKQLNKLAWLCFIAPGVGFAILMPMGAYITQGAEFSWELLLICLVPFFIINNLLLINQLPDLEADRSIGRKHIAIRYGANSSVRVFAIATSASFFVLGYLVLQNSLPLFALASLIPLCFCLISLVYLVKLKENIAQHLPAMGLVAAAANITPLMLSLVLFFN